MQAFENFITAAKSGGGEDLSGDMAGLGGLKSQTSSSFLQLLPAPREFEQNQPIETRASLAFLLSDRGNFFREFLLDEVSSRTTFVIYFRYNLTTFFGPPKCYCILGFTSELTA